MSVAFVNDSELTTVIIWEGACRNLLTYYVIVKVAISHCFRQLIEIAVAVGMFVPLLLNALRSRLKYCGGGAGRTFVVCGFFESEICHLLPFCLEVLAY